MSGIARDLSGHEQARAKELLLLRSNSCNAIADIVSECNLLSAYSIRAFARTTAPPPHQWLLEQRIAEARVLIKTTERPLAEIAMICGFSDQSHLSRVFLKMCGATPGAWRRAARTWSLLARAKLRATQSDVARSWHSVLTPSRIACIRRIFCLEHASWNAHNSYLRTTSYAPGAGSAIAT
ncbi:AraC family transcriptional regulator [Paraburkholderia sp. JHI2823]|uniref:helix-turn-helix domain-containing protein n=1 Tax=Paraburkholderia sp. JHI2823 TaxID=3112960 RepID=UPI003173113A